MIKYLRRQESVEAYTAFIAWVIPEYQAVDLEAQSEEESDGDGEGREEGDGGLGSASSTYKISPTGLEEEEITSSPGSSS